LDLLKPAKQVFLAFVVLVLHIQIKAPYIGAVPVSIGRKTASPLSFKAVIVFIFGAGWSSPVARQAHNLKVVGSNPTPATKTSFQFIKQDK
jgi:hypothetical protein